MLVFDKSGNCPTFFNYVANMVDFNKVMIKQQIGQSTKEDSIEVVRKALVGSMLHGKCMVINVDNLRPSFRNDYTSGELPEEAFNFEEWRKDENYLKVVKEEENVSTMGSKNCYSMGASFTMIILA